MGDIGKFISQLRQDRNLTQKELADKMHLSVSTISKWENGISLPNVSFFEELAKALDITVMDLFDCIMEESPKWESRSQGESQRDDIEVAVTEIDEQVEDVVPEGEVLLEGEVPSEEEVLPENEMPSEDEVLPVKTKKATKLKLLFGVIAFVAVLSVAVGFFFHRDQGNLPDTEVVEEFLAEDVEYYGYSDVYYVIIEYEGELTDDFVQEYRDKLREDYEKQSEEADLLVVLFVNNYLGKESMRAPDLELVLLPGKK